MSCTANSRQERVFNASLALLLHRCGPSASPENLLVMLDKCVPVAVALEAKVESALSQTVPPKDGAPF